MSTLCAIRFVSTFIIPIFDFTNYSLLMPNLNFYANAKLHEIRKNEFHFASELYFRVCIRTVSTRNSYLRGHGFN